MKDDVAEDEHEENDHDTQVAPILAGNDLAGRNGRKREQETDVDERRCNGPDIRGQQNGYAAGEPKHDEADKRPAVDRQPARPVRNCREQKAGDRFRHIAVEHLVDVPVERAEFSRHRDKAQILRGPEQDVERCPRSSGEKKWPEAVREQGRAGVAAAALQGGGHRHDYVSRGLRWLHRRSSTFSCVSDRKRGATFCRSVPNLSQRKERRPGSAIVHLKTPVFSKRRARCPGAQPTCRVVQLSNSCCTPSQHGSAKFAWRMAYVTNWGDAARTRKNR